MSLFMKMKLPWNITYIFVPLLLILSACGGGEKEGTISNMAPSVNAGLDLSVPEGSVVGLSAAATDNDGSILSFRWSQTNGPAVVIKNATSAKATFNAPEIQDDSGNIESSFVVTVTDSDGESASDTVNITIVDTVAGNSPPSVEAGQDQSAPEGHVVELSAIAADIDGSISSYNWSQTSGPYVSISGANQAVATITVPQVDIDTQLTFQLTVFDNDGASNSDTIAVIAENTTLMQPIVNIQRNGNDLEISWNDANAAQYRVLYWRNGSRPSEQLSTSNNLDLEDLPAGIYNVLVEAYDSLGYSIFSVPVQVGV